MSTTTAILQPSKDVSPRYRTTLLETTAGKVYQGIILYEAVDGLILQTGPAATVRLRGDQIAERRASPLSLMPTGLLDRLDAVGGLRHDLDVLLAGEQHPEARADHGLVVGDQDADAHRRCRPSGRRVLRRKPPPAGVPVVISPS